MKPKDLTPAEAVHSLIAERAQLIKDKEVLQFQVEQLKLMLDEQAIKN